MDRRSGRFVLVGWANEIHRKGVSGKVVAIGMAWNGSGCLVKKAPNREEGGFIFFMPGFLEFPLHGNVSRIAITYGYFSRPVIVVSYIMYHPKVIFVIGVGVTAIALPHCCFGLWYLFLRIRYDIGAQWQTPGGANPRRGAHPYVSGPAWFGATGVRRPLSCGARQFTGASL